MIKCINLVQNYRYLCKEISAQFSSVAQLCPTLLQHCGLQHARPLCPSPTPRVYSNSCPLSLWCHPMGWPYLPFRLFTFLSTILTAVVLFLFLWTSCSLPLWDLCACYSLYLKWYSCISVSYLTPSYPLDLNRTIASQRSLPWLFWPHPNFICLLQHHILIPPLAYLSQL